MDESKKELWRILSHDCVQLHSDLGEFTYLSTVEERVALLNETAPDFFGRLQGTLWNAMLLQVCRLTDPAQTSGKDNLSLGSFLKMTACDRDSIHQDRAAMLVVKAVGLSDFARDWRNRRIAHRDLSTATGASLCANGTLLQLRQSVSAIGEAMDAMDPGGGQTAWDPGLSGEGCRPLLDYLREGLISHNKLWAAFERGEIGLGETWSEPEP